MRYDEQGQPTPCKVFVPRHLAKILYRETLKARKGEAPADHPIEETDLVIKLIEKWAEGQDPVDWPKLLAELKAEAEAAEAAGKDLGPDAKVEKLEGDAAGGQTK